MIVGKVVIYKALHKGNVNYRLTVLGLSTYSADSRAVTKQGLFDCEPAYTADRMVQCDKTTFCTVGEDAKCNIQICFHLWQSVNENKCITAVRIPTKVIDENLWNPRRLRVPSVNKTAQAVVLPSIKGNLHPLWELHTKFPEFNRCKKQNENPRRTSCLVSAG